MSDGSDYVLRPVMLGILRYESLFDGSVTLENIGQLNEALDVRDENTKRMRNRDK